MKDCLVKVIVTAVAIMLFGNIQLSASYYFSENSNNQDQIDCINLKPIYISKPNEQKNLVQDFSDLIDKLPYPINQDGTLQEPENLPSLLEEVDANDCNDLCNDLTKATAFITKAASHPDNIYCLVYVFLYTDLIQRLRDNDQLDSVLAVIKKGCANYCKNELIRLGKCKKECIEKNSCSCFYSGCLGSINSLCLTILLPLTPFFSSDEFIYRYLMVDYIRTVDIFYCAKDDILKMLFVSALIKKGHVLRLLESTYNYIRSELICFKFSKQSFISLLKYVVSSKELVDCLKSLLIFQANRCKFNDTSLFESKLRLTSNELQQIIDYANNKIPHDTLQWIQTVYLK